MTGTTRTTEIGEPGEGTAFFPFRYHDRLRFDRWLPGVEGNRVYAVRNLQDHAEPWRGVPIPAHRLLLVTDTDRPVSARTRLDMAGHYLLVAEFSTGFQAGDARCFIRIGGRPLWTGAGGHSTHLVAVPAGSIVDFGAEGIDGGAWVALRYAIFAADAAGRPGMRIDDNRSGLDSAEALNWLRQPPPPHAAPAPRHRDRDARIAALQKSSSMDRDYLGIQLATDLPDFVDRVLRDAQPPARKYVIFFTPRSGSTMLTDVLARTEALGYPAEYFVPEWLRSLALAFSDLEDSYEALILRRFQSPNRVFGIEIEGGRIARERGFFGSLADWRVIYLIRRDLLAQALSYHMALGSGVWHQFTAGRAQAAVPFAREKIVAHLNEMLRQEQLFEAMFRQEAVTPHRLDYERLTTGLAQEAAQVAAFIGVPGLDFSSADPDRTSLRPTRSIVNQLYTLLVMADGGAFYGYDIHALDDGYAALLHGIDPALLPPVVEERAPAILLAGDPSTLRRRVREMVEQAYQACLEQSRLPGARLSDADAAMLAGLGHRLADVGIGAE